MTTTTITAGDASNGLVTTGGNDGTLVIQSGPAGSKVNAITISATGVVQQLAQSMVRVNTVGGNGATNTAIRYFTTVVTNQGSDITYTASSTNGDSFTINTAGVYAISYTDNYNASGDTGISLNSAQLSTPVGTITASTRLAQATSSAANYCACATWTGYLPATSVIRAHGSGGTVGASGSEFTITRVS